MEEFNLQINRLNSQWRNAYSDERRLLLWDAFRFVDYDDFRNAMDCLLLNSRALPMFDDMDKAINRAVSKKKERALAHHYASFDSIFSEAVDKANPESKAFAKECLALLRDKQTGRITREQFFEGCSLLDTAAKAIEKRKNPGQGSRGY